jgi:aerobic-type carbon monoxide dehydrogenase small subunit (CoxS/CutS family)
MSSFPISLTVNGRAMHADVEARITLADVLRDHFGLTGTHVGCEQGACGSCTVLVDGDSVRSCLMLAVQADGTQVTTVEALGDDGQMSSLQESFSEHHALQCGFCTPGILMAAAELLAETSNPTSEEVRDRMRGNLCRCTGYSTIVDAIVDAGT